MTTKAYLLSESDRQILLRVLDEARSRQLNTQNRPAVPEEQGNAPEVYVVRLPDGGIEETVDDYVGTADPIATVGYADCDVYRLAPVDQPGTGTLPEEFTLEKVEGLTKRVFNLSSDPVRGSRWALVERDKFGSWTTQPQSPFVVVDVLLPTRFGQTLGQIVTSEPDEHDLHDYYSPYGRVENVFVSSATGENSSFPLPFRPGRYIGRVTDVEGPISHQVPGVVATGDDVSVAEGSRDFFIGDTLTISDAANSEQVKIGIPADISHITLRHVVHDYINPVLTLPQRVTVTVFNDKPFWGKVVQRFEPNLGTVEWEPGTSTATAIVRKKVNAYQITPIGLDVPTIYRDLEIALNIANWGRAAPIGEYIGANFSPFCAFEVHGYFDYPLSQQSVVMLYPMQVRIKANINLIAPILAGSSVVLDNTVAVQGTSPSIAADMLWPALATGMYITLVEGDHVETVGVLDTDLTGEAGNGQSITIGEIKLPFTTAAEIHWWTTIYWFDGYASSLPFFATITASVPFSGQYFFQEVQGTVTGLLTPGGRTNITQSGADEYTNRFACREVNGRAIGDSTIVEMHLCPMEDYSGNDGTYFFWAHDPGPQGAQGYQGRQGTQGAGSQGGQGAQGFQGSQGPADGAQGNQGVQGAQGYQGNQGNQGSGSQGSQGNQGTQGPSGGAQGNQGSQGSQGFQGNQGNTGTTGSQGNQGFQGPADGAQGAQGDAGTMGAQGAAGFQGATGLNGVAGAQGAQGDAGSQGSQGTAGAAGPQGSQGSTGAAGTQGAQGNQGFQGRQGFQGTAGADGATGAQGFQGVAGAQGNQGFQGAAGAQGNQGFQGTSGVAGSQGYWGGPVTLPYTFSTTTTDSDPGNGNLRLSASAQSLSTVVRVSPTDNLTLNQSNVILQFDGAAASGQNPAGQIRLVGQTDQTKWIAFNVQTVTTMGGGTYYNLSISLIGGSTTSPFANGDIVLLMWQRSGDKGSQGTTGSTGSQGSQGNTGSTGSQGSQGAQGKQGNQGDTGAAGAQGGNGFQGFQGLQGRQGTVGGTGAQGAQGFQGSQGNQGSTGAQGAQGSQGSQGSQGNQGFQGNPAPYSFLANGGPDFFSRQAPATYTTRATEKYGPDRYRMVSQSASLQCQRVDTNGALESGYNARYYANFKQITNAGKFMILQILEGRDTFPLAGRTMIFQLKLKGSATKTIRVGIVQLNSSGTVDTWPAATQTAWGANSTDPTLGTNLAYVGTPSSKSVLTTWSLFSFSVALPADAKNIAVAFWTDSQFSANDVLSVGELGLYDGSATQAYLPMSRQAEADRCTWFCQAYGGAVNEFIGQAIASSTTAATCTVQLSGPLRVSPTVSISANADWSLANPGVAETALTGTPTVVASGQRTLALGCTVALGLVQAHAYQLIASSSGGAGTASLLILDSEL